MGWRVAVAAALLCGVSHGRPSLLGAALGDHEGDHGDHQVSQAGDYSDYSQAGDYSDYDYQPTGRDLSAGDDYYSDYTPSSAYAFQFSEDGQSRQEEQDEAGVVTGSYSYTGQDGAQHTVTYRAGAGIGFQIIDPEVQQSFGEKTAESLPEVAARDTAPWAAAAPNTLYGAPSEELPAVVVVPDTLYGAPAEDLAAYAEEPLPAYTEEEAAPAMMMMDPSYYFQYSGPDSDRTEDADSSGAVVGSYSYNTPGGQRVLVRYTAGADTGFVIENQEELDAVLAKAASEPFVAAEPSKERKVIKVRKQVAAGGRQQEHVFTLQEEEDPLPSPLAGAPPAPAALYSAPAEELPGYEVAAQPSYREEEVVEEEEEATTMSMMMDPSYNFGYTGEAGSREETADSQGDVTGQYSYTSPEGQEILVRYRAGADTGFVIENQEELAASVRAATDAGAEAAAARVADTVAAAATSDAGAVVISVPNALYGAPSAPEAAADSAPLPSYSEPLPSYSETEATPTTMVMDASFDFSVDESDHSFQESADQAGERRGSYSFVTPEGRTVEVRYTAGRGGFVILNPEDVLPQP